MPQDLERKQTIDYYRHIKNEWHMIKLKFYTTIKIKNNT